ncbi:MAG: UDP-glucose 4-epimerase [Solirubrobacteraceae bacterium]|nr:UDP-glucose 4-epimerase [Solirubrobacteraceae bacterium]
MAVPPAKRAPAGLTVAVTGPTGDIGKAFVSALERSRSVKKVLGMARRPFDPAAQGWKKTEYRQGDVLDRAAVDDFVKGADVVVHLAFIIFGGPQETRKVNLEGSRHVFEAAAAARRVKRLVYASSVAAYGFHDDGERPERFTEDIPPRGTEGFYYSAQKAELEGLLAEVLEGNSTEAYVFRPCIVAGPGALILIENLPYVSLSDKLPGAVRRLLDVMPVLRPVLPDPGVPFQLVHTDDVATALRAAVLGRGEPGVYNLAADGELTASDLASALGWYSIPVPEIAVDATAHVAARLPFLPPEADWLHAFRVPTLMDASKARRELGWRPRHDARETLQATVRAAREEGLLD